MVRPSYWIFPAHAPLLLWLVLHSGSWCLHTSAEPIAILGVPLLSNSSGNRTDLVVPLTCQSFQCSGERCYQEAAVALGNSTWESCRNASHCELFRLNRTSYSAGCSPGCGSPGATEACAANSSTGMEQCIVECCSSPICLRLNATAYGDLPPTSTPVPTTTTTTAATTTITTTAAPKNGKVCGHFTCHGEGCYRRQKASTSCYVGFDFCEMKKTGPHFVAGCSKACQTAGPACTTRSTAPCYQECCPARPKSSCLKLDGKVHFNLAGRPGPAPLIPLLACAAAIAILTCALPLSMGPK